LLLTTNNQVIFVANRRNPHKVKWAATKALAQAKVAADFLLKVGEVEAATSTRNSNSNKWATHLPTHNTEVLRVKAVARWLLLSKDRAGCRTSQTHHTKLLVAQPFHLRCPARRT
jgi:hypothetical protein